MVNKCGIYFVPNLLIKPYKEEKEGEESCSGRSNSYLNDIFECVVTKSRCHGRECEDEGSSPKILLLRGQCLEPKYF